MFNRFCITEIGYQIDGKQFNTALTNTGYIAYDNNIYLFAIDLPVKSNSGDKEDILILQLLQHEGELYPSVQIFGRKGYIKKIGLKLADEKSDSEDNSVIISIDRMLILSRDIDDIVGEDHKFKIENVQR